MDVVITWDSGPVSLTMNHIWAWPLYFSHPPYNFALTSGGKSYAYHVSPCFQNSIRQSSR